jgi:hypothetical protein
MKKKNDDLLRLAFGELSDADATVVEARAAADPSARRELQVCRDIRASLQHLPPPPADGLSTERLRAAILDRELGAKKPGFNWGWAPMALAAMAAVVFITRPGQRSEPTLVSMNNEIGENVFKNKPLMSDFSASASAPAPVTMSVATPAATPAKSAARFRSNQRGVEGARPHTAWVPKPVFKAQPNNAPQYALMSSFDDLETIASPQSSVDTDALASKANKDGADTVVIVSGKRDLDTGAAAATETEANHVLVGG